MRKFKLLALFLMLSTLTFAQKTIRMQVKESKVPCQGVVAMQCLQVKVDKEKDYTYFYDTIEGFDYQPGYVYDLKVVRTKRVNIPADASAYSYTLKKIVKKTAVKQSSKIDQVKKEFENQKMILTRMNGKNVDNGSIYGTLDTSSNTFYGKSGCNNFNTGFELKGQDIHIHEGMGTLMACDEKSMALENEFLTALRHKQYKIVQSGNTVQFNDIKTKKNVLTFTIASAKDVWNFIDGKKFKLFQLDNVGMDYGRAFIQFNVTEGKVNGNSGCNSFFGKYTSTKETITTAGLASTRMGCLNDETAQTERKVLNYLSDSTLKFDVAETVINFYKDNRLVMSFGLWDNK